MRIDFAINFHPHNLSNRGQTIDNRERISIKMANTWSPIINGSHRGIGGGIQQPVSFLHCMYCNFSYDISFFLDHVINLCCNIHYIIISHTISYCNISPPTYIPLEHDAA